VGGGNLKSTKTEEGKDGRTHNIKDTGKGTTKRILRFVGGQTNKGFEEGIEGGKQVIGISNGGREKSSLSGKVKDFQPEKGRQRERVLMILHQGEGASSLGVMYGALLTEERGEEKRA